RVPEGDGRGRRRLDLRQLQRRRPLLRPGIGQPAAGLRLRPARRQARLPDDGRLLRRALRRGLRSVFLPRIYADNADNADKALYGCLGVPRRRFAWRARELRTISAFLLYPCYPRNRWLTAFVSGAGA